MNNPTLSPKPASGAKQPAASVSDRKSKSAAALKRNLARRKAKTPSTRKEG